MRRIERRLRVTLGHRLFQRTKAGVVDKPAQQALYHCLIVKTAQDAAAPRNEVFALNDLRVDLTARRVWKNGKPVRLTPREYALLEMLIRKRDLALTRGELLTTAWGYEYVGASRTVDVHINRLRTKLGLIHTVFKVGYRLNTNPGC